MTANPIERLDVPATQLTAEIIARRAARRPEPMVPECFHCGSRKGPWVPDPSGARWPSGAQVMECRGRCTAADPDRHALDTDIAYVSDQLVIAHPEACSKDPDYPGFADWVARQQKKNEAARRARTKVRTGGRARIDARAAADAEATHWRRLGITPPADGDVRPTDAGSQA